MAKPIVHVHVRGGNLGNISALIKRTVDELTGNVPRDIHTEIAAGKPQRQAVAIALATHRKKAGDCGCEHVGDPARDTEPHAAGALIIAKDTGRVLLQQRGKGDTGGTYGLFGGSMMPGETPEAAVRREVLEETGHNLPATIQALHEAAYDSGFTYHSFLAHVEAEFEPVLNDESKGAVWADPNRLPAPLHPGFAAMLKEKGSGFLRNSGT